jgi:enamine deaminase RidA (YjgF/YER057c/UK114 family)
MTVEVLGTPGRGRAEGRFLTNCAKANGLVFTTLHHGFAPHTYDRATETGVLPDDAATQTTNALYELSAVLADAGSSLSEVLKANLYVDSDQTDLELCRHALVKFFQDHGVASSPAVTVLGVALCQVKIAADLIAFEPHQSDDLQACNFILIGAQAADSTGAPLPFAEQIEGCLSAVERLLAQANLTIHDLVKVNTFLTPEMMSVEGYAAYNVAYNEFFASHEIVKKPARSTIGVRFVNPAELVQVEAIAAISGARDR